MSVFDRLWSRLKGFVLRGPVFDRWCRVLFLDGDGDVVFKTGFWWTGGDLTFECETVSLYGGAVDSVAFLKGVEYDGDVVVEVFRYGDKVIRFVTSDICIYSDEWGCGIVFSGPVKALRVVGYGD